MSHAFRVGDRVIVAPEAYTNAGNSGVITLIDGDMACVIFDDGTGSAYLLDDGELLIQETVPIVSEFTTINAPARGIMP